MTKVNTPSPRSSFGLRDAFQPRPWPNVERLSGRHVALERLCVERHADALWSAIGADEALWAYVPSGPFPTNEAFRSWLMERSAREDHTTYAIVTTSDGQASGIFAFMQIVPQFGTVETGSIMYGPALSRQIGGTEALYLQGRYVFDELNYRRLEWRCNALNKASRRAAERFGFKHEGDIRQHMTVKGKNRDTSLYSILDSEWPALRDRLENWLAPTNFDEHGRQLRPL